MGAGVKYRLGGVGHNIWLKDTHEIRLARMAETGWLTIAHFFASLRIDMEARVCHFDQPQIIASGRRW